MRVRGDIESVNLATGERFQRVTGDGESRLEQVTGCDCVHHRRLGPPPWYPYRSQEESDKEREKFIDSLVAELKSREEKREMSWSVGAIGKAGAMRTEIAAQFTRGGKCVEPEESIRQDAAKLIDKALESVTGPFVVKVQASGSQSYKNHSKPEDGICNNLAINIEIQHNFVE